MEDNSSNQAQSEKKQTSIEEITAEAEKLLTQIKQVVENCQSQEDSLNEKTQGVIKKTESLTQEQGKIEGLLQQILQAQKHIVSQKKTTDEIVQAVQESQATINAAAKQIQQTETAVDSNNERIQELKTAIETTKKEATDLKATIDADNSAIQQAKIEVDSNAKAIIQSKATVDQLEAELNAIAEIADEKTKTITDFKGELQELNTAWKITFDETLTEKSNNLSDLQETYSQKYEKLEAKINSLLPGATSVGLAKAFMERKNYIESQKKFWRNMTILGAFGLVLFGILAIKYPPKITNGLYEFVLYILTRSSILVGVVMIEEFGRRHFNIISRLAETYAYKEVLSSSFEGYKKQMETVDLKSTIAITETDTDGKEIQKNVPMKASSKLSDNLLNNLREDPSNIYEKEKPVPAPVIDMPDLAVRAINKAIEQYGKNKFDIGWRIFAIALAIVVATAATIMFLVKAN